MTIKKNTENAVIALQRKPVDYCRALTTASEAAAAAAMANEGPRGAALSACIGPLLHGRAVKKPRGAIVARAVTEISRGQGDNERRSRSRAAQGKFWYNARACIVARARAGECVRCHADGGGPPSSFPPRPRRVMACLRGWTRRGRRRRRDKGRNEIVLIFLLAMKREVKSSI